jgi:hypothetical protein
MSCSTAELGGFATVRLRAGCAEPDFRPNRQIDKNLLRRTAGPYIGSGPGHRRFPFSGCAAWPAGPSARHPGDLGRRLNSGRSSRRSRFSRDQVTVSPSRESVVLMSGLLFLVLVVAAAGLAVDSVVDASKQDRRGPL